MTDFRTKLTELMVVDANEAAIEREIMHEIAAVLESRAASREAFVRRMYAIVIPAGPHQSSATPVDAISEAERRENEVWRQTRAGVIN